MTTVTFQTGPEIGPQSLLRAQTIKSTPAHEIQVFSWSAALDLYSEGANFVI